MVQLAQPYVISSMRLLLWDCDDRSYSYYIEVSTNQRHWEMVCNRSRENCKSWQTIRFNPLPVVYIRIVGTNNSANEVSIINPSISSVRQVLIGNPDFFLDFE